MVPLLALKVVLSSRTKSCEIQLLNSLVAIQCVSYLRPPTNQRHPTKEPCSKRTAKWAWPWACFFSFAVSIESEAVGGWGLATCFPRKALQITSAGYMGASVSNPREPTFRMHLMFKKVMACFNKDILTHLVLMMTYIKLMQREMWLYFIFMILNFVVFWFCFDSHFADFGAH